MTYEEFRKMTDDFVKDVLEVADKKDPATIEAVTGLLQFYAQEL